MCWWVERAAAASLVRRGIFTLRWSVGRRAWIGHTRATRSTCKTQHLFTVCCGQLRGFAVALRMTTMMNQVSTLDVRQPRPDRRRLIQMSGQSLRLRRA